VKGPGGRKKRVNGQGPKQRCGKPDLVLFGRFMKEQQGNFTRKYIHAIPKAEIAKGEKSENWGTGNVVN